MKRAIVVVLFSLVNIRASAQSNIVQPWETLPSFKSNQVFHVGPLDDVSLFSGDPQLTVPLGPEFTLSPGVKWQLSAHYSSRMWHMWSQYCNGAGTCGGYLNRARLGGNSALGAGWSIDVGHIIAGSAFPGEDTRARYRSPSGSITFLGEPGADGYRLPDDRSFVRFSSQPIWAMQRPDGTTWEFTHQFYAPTSANSYDYCDDDRVGSGIVRYGLEAVKDRFGAVILSVVYDPVQPWQIKTITLAGGETLTFAWGDYQRQSGTPIWKVLNSVSFSKIGGSSLAVVFQRHPDGRIGRSNFEQGITNSCTQNPTTIDGPLLKSIDVGGHLYSFNYLADPSTGFQTLLSSYSLPTGGSVSFGWESNTVLNPCVEGPSCSPEVTPVAQGLTAIETEDPCSDRQIHLQKFIDASPGVISRSEADPFGVNTVTTYARKQFGGKLDASGSAFDPDLIVRQVVVVRPDGNQGFLSTKHIFTPDGAELERRHYSNATITEPPVRTQIFCYDAQLPFSTVCGVINPLSQDYSQFAAVWAILPLQQSREVTWYGVNPQPGGACIDSSACRFLSRSNWNALAREYGTEASGVEYTNPSFSSIMVQPNFLRRETTTNWIPSFVTTAWMPKIFDSRTTRDVYCQQAPCNNVTFGYCPTGAAPCDQTKNYGYLTNGNLSSVSVSDSRAGYVGSVTATYSQFMNNDPTTETVTGTGVVSGSVVTTRTYQANSYLSQPFQGTLSLHRVLTGKRDPFTFFSFDVDREDETGFIKTSRDPNNTLATTYTYDSLGRLKTVEPPGELKTTICYKDADGSTPPYVIVRRTASTSETDWCNSTVVAPAEGAAPVEAYAYDGFGRQIREIRKLANTISGGGLAFKATIFNSAGYVQDETEWQPCQSNSISACLTMAPVAGQRTTYSNFDFLGRWRHRVGADGAVVDRSFDDPAPIWNSDTAELVTLRNVNAAPGGGGGSLAYTCKRSDVFKRTFVTSIPGDTLFSPPAPAFSFRCGPLTNHTWNVLDKISGVAQAAADGTTQSRSFDYDKMGNLRAESHPELHPQAGPATDNGVVAYSSFDVLGDVLTRTESDGRAISSTYDTLGRLKTVGSSDGNYRTNSYDGNGFAGGTYKLGRLTKQVTSNPGSLLENATVEEEYSYDGLGGRLSARTTRLKRAAGTTLLQPSQTFSWNNLGLLETHAHGWVSGSFSTTTYYTSGLPTRLVAGAQNIVSGATYSAFGGLQSYTTADGVQTTLTPDASGLPRPASIATSGIVPGASNFSTGTISYDGVGNIRQMQLSPSATDSFEYDLAGRLKKATWGTLGAGVTDEFTYDGTTTTPYPAALFPAGNLTEKKVDGSAIALTVDPRKNRLSSGAYGASGELRAFGTKTYSYDKLLRQVRFSQTGSSEDSIYGSDDERIARVIPSAAVPETSKASRLFTITPCRLYDSRSAGGVLSPGVERGIQATGNCGIPSNATALAANLTAINYSGENGTVRAYPSGLGFRPLVTSNAIRAGRTRATMNLIELGDPGSAEPGRFRLLSDMPTAGVDAIVDVSGYFAPVSTATGSSWYITLRDNDHRLSTEYRWDETGSVMNLLSDHIYLGNIRVATLGTSSTEGVPLGMTYYSTDHLGTPRLSHTTGGTVVAAYRYRSFGEPFTGTVVNPGTATTQGLGFALMERDAVSGDHYDHARFYSGYVGRFNRPDLVNGEVEDPASWNRYTYARNNPLKYVDPDGQNPLLIYGQQLLQRVATHPATQRVVTWVAAQGTSLWNSATRFFNSPGGQAAVQAAADLASGSVTPSAVPAAAVEEVVASSGRAASAQAAEGARAIAKKLGRAAREGYDSAFAGIKPTQANAESLIRNILGNPSKVVTLEKYVDVYNKAGQGVRVERGTNRFVGFLEEILEKGK